ncbi:MAG: Ldh family oxidoreductase, partial [Victivallales bacterium]|nr:Ldh family oxidoreductase [Victivallales bacterium]
MEDKIYYLDFKTLENFMRDSLVGAGVPLEDAKICADVLITADKRGIDSHGIGRLKPIY